ncbi:MAG: SDR family NAD(P)-dependent oxidoreductase [Chitinophagaceae bacterium]|nr:MAG: SDR family NAD(P)-dependent oxidoreductase [Chitinophagaceae bacterium]
MNSLYTCRTIFTLVLVIALSGCATSRLNKADQKRTEGRTIVVTGASSGFGRGVALRLGEYGANVVLAARRTAELEEVASQIRAAGGKALVVTTDVSKPDEIERLASEAVKAFGKVDVWINNAGVGSVGPFWDVPVNEHARVIDVNLKGVLYGMHTALKLFRKQGHGVIVNTGSVESEVPVAYHSSYAATKAGIRSLGNALHQELRLNGLKKKIRVVTVLPWAADTPFFVNGGNHSGGTLRTAAMDDPWKVVNVIIYATLHRRRELPAGWKARTSYRLHHVLPHFTERLAAGMAQHYQIKTAPPAPHTSGNLFETKTTGTTVEGGVRARMKAEKSARKQAKREKRKQR